MNTVTAGATTQPLFDLVAADLAAVDAAIHEVAEVDNPFLRQTLRLTQPPLPTQADDAEATTIDQLTLPSTFNYELQALQTGGAALVLDPAT